MINYFWPIWYFITHIIFRSYSLFLSKLRLFFTKYQCICTWRNLIVLVFLLKGARYWSDVSVHRDGTEMTDGIYRMFVAGLREYISRNNQAPSRIFFYRDGVGEGQIVQVHFFVLMFRTGYKNSPLKYNFCIWDK